MGLVPAYLVLGPESSGTRMVTGLLIAAGCEGEDTHRQAFDEGIPEAKAPIVWRRSFPHGFRWPDVGGMVRLLRQAGYRPHAVVTVRDYVPMIASQVKNGHADSVEIALCNIRRAYPRIFSSLEAAGAPFTVASYEGLTLQPEAAGALLKRLGLPVAEFEVYDGNAKYYEP